MENNSFTYDHNQPKQSVFLVFRKSPVFPMHLAQPSAVPVAGGGAPEHALCAWTTFPFHLMVATFSHVPPYQFPGRGRAPGVVGPGRCGAGVGAEKALAG